MNKQEQINNSIRELDLEQGQAKTMNAIKIHQKEGEEHFKMKCKICWDLHKEDKDFLTEAYTKDRSRKFDIVDLIDCDVIEIESKLKNMKKDADKTIYIGKEKSGGFEI